MMNRNQLQVGAEVVALSGGSDPRIIVRGIVRSTLDSHGVLVVTIFVKGQGPMFLTNTDMGWMFGGQPVGVEVIS